MPHYIITYDADNDNLFRITDHRFEVVSEFAKQMLYSHDRPPAWTVWEADIQDWTRRDITAEIVSEAREAAYDRREELREKWSNFGG